MGHQSTISETGTADQSAAKQVAKSRERTPAETAYMEEQAERIAETVAAPKISALEITDEGVLKIVVAPEDRELWDSLDRRAFGTNDPDVSNWSHNWMVHALGKHNLNKDGINAALGILHGLQPRDEIEGMLITQMIAVHVAACETANKFHVAQMPGEVSNILNKLMRTFTTQMEALNRYRGKGQQKVTVEHVHVHEGGQAIVGNVEEGGGRPRRKAGGQPHATGPEMRSQDEGGKVVPLASHG